MNVQHSLLAVQAHIQTKIVCECMCVLLMHRPVKPLIPSIMRLFF